MELLLWNRAILQCRKVLTSNITCNATELKVIGGWEWKVRTPVQFNFNLTNATLPSLGSQCLVVPSIPKQFWYRIWYDEASLNLLVRCFHRHGSVSPPLVKDVQPACADSQWRHIVITFRHMQQQIHIVCLPSNGIGSIRGMLRTSHGSCKKLICTSVYRIVSVLIFLFLLFVVSHTVMLIMWLTSLIKRQRCR